jgi:DNA-binding winged helix-turn-helix (wHTH) protein/tetratricopeptide (TPR) repeat protein
MLLSESSVATEFGIEVVYRFGAFELKVEPLELRCDGELMQVDLLVLRLLACLVRQAGQLVTKDELVAAVWERRAVADNAITVAMARLRKTLGQSASQTDLISTVYGRGYRFAATVTEERRNIRRSEVQAKLVHPLPPTPFVGRESVLGALDLALADSLGRHGRACLLMGEPGIGKTRAVEMFEARAGIKGAHVVWGYCREGGDTPPLAPVLRAFRELINDPDLGLVLGDMHDVLALFADQRSARPVNDADARVCALNGPSRYEGYDVLIRGLKAAAAEVPLVLVFDDLHRADAATLDFLRLLLDEIARSRIMLIATLRLNEAPAQDQLPRILGHRNCERIKLDRLSQQDVESYVAAVLDDPQNQLGAAVFAKSEGNPFFMVELSRQLCHTERPDRDMLTVQEVALDLIKPRLSQLDAAARGLLSAAAVIGRSFELPLLQRICENEPAEIATLLDAAIEAEVVVAAPDSTTAFAFGHDLLRGALYDALPGAERRRWHIRIAEALERSVHEGAHVPPSELAYHLYAALPESNLRKTVHYCREAAAAAAVYGNPDVVRYLRQALEALSLMDNPSPRLRMELMLKSLVYARGCAHTVYAALLDRVLKLAQEQADPWTLIRAAYMLNAHPGFQALPGMHTILTRALSMLDASAYEPRALGLAALGCCAPVCYDRAQAQQAVTEATNLARSAKSTLALSGALLCRLYVEGGLTFADQCAALYDELTGMAREHPEMLAVVPAELALHRSVIALQRGDVTAQAAALADLEACARQLKHIELTWHSERWRTLRSINTAANQQAIEALQRLHKRARRQGIVGHETFCAFDEQVVLAVFGRAPSVDERTREALTPESHDSPSIWALKIRALATAGLTQSARAALQMHSAHLATLPCDRDHLGTLGHIARAAVLLEARDVAATMYEVLLPWAESFAGHVSYFSEGPVSQLLGMLAVLLGQPAQAKLHFERALVLAQRAELGLRAAEIRLQLARCLLQEGAPQSTRAHTLVSKAYAKAEQLGARGLTRDAASLLQRLSR